MRKFKNLLILLLTLAICVTCFAACGGTQKPETSGPQNGTTTTGPATGGSENLPQTPDKDPEGDDENPSGTTNPDNGDEKPEEPQQPITPQDPVQPENPNEPDGDDNGENKTEPTKPVPETPDEPEEPQPPIILPEKQALAEGEPVLIEKSDAVYTFTAKECAYYIVKIAGESASGALYIDDAATAGAESEFYLRPVQLEEGQTIELTAEICGGEIGVFKAAELEKNEFDEYAATSTSGQKYFVLVAESDGEFSFDLLLDGSAAASAIGTCYIAGSIYYDGGENISAWHSCNLKQDEIVAVWVQTSEVNITVIVF